jgi:hypothetical protein
VIFFDAKPHLSRQRRHIDRPRERRRFSVKLLVSDFDTIGGLVSARWATCLNAATPRAGRPAVHRAARKGGAVRWLR